MAKRLGKANKHYCDLLSEGGVSLIEVLVALVIFSIMGLSVAYSTMAKMNAQARNVRNNLALQIAMDSLEQYAAIDPDTLDDTDDSTGVTVQRQGINFLRDIFIIYCRVSNSVGFSQLDDFFRVI